MKTLLEISSFYKSVPKITIVWCTVPEIQGETEFFVVLDQFLPFYPPMDSEYFKNMKKTPEDIIILQMSTINDSYMMYAL